MSAAESPSPAGGAGTAPADPSGAAPTGALGAAPAVGGRRARFTLPAREAAALLAIFVGAAALRLLNLPVRGGWDSDQGTEMLALRSALDTARLPTFGPQAISVGGAFHHGALYYDLLLPAAWLGNGDPLWVVAEIALLSLIVVPVAWWIARSIGGPAAGLTAALMAAVSASLIGYATFIWNPTLVETGAALAYLGAWEAWRRRSGRWWLLAAFGAAVAMQSHVAAAVILLPLMGVFAAAVVRTRGRRIATTAWGLAGVALVAVTYLPLIGYEFGHDFAETRGMVGYFNTSDGTATLDPVTRVFFAALRILAWPLTRWPLVDLKPGLFLAVAVAFALTAGLIWLATRAGKVSGRPAEAAPSPETTPSAAIERSGARFVGGALFLLIVGLGLGLKAVSQIQDLPTEQYHVVADPLVFVAAGLIAGALWRASTAAGRERARAAGRGAVVVALAAIVVWNAGHWPPLASPDGGWPAAQSAAAEVRKDAAGTSVALVPLYAPKGSDAYGYPLALDGIGLVDPRQAQTVVLLCDSFWLPGCGGAQEEAWIAANSKAGALELVERIEAAPDRTLSVYRRAP